MKKPHTDVFELQMVSKGKYLHWKKSRIKLMDELSLFKNIKQIT